jgi:sodium/bile acid cotransporter 7
MMARMKLQMDSMTWLLLAVIAAASFFPCQGTWALASEHLTTFMIGLLFFMHGARLSREAVLAGAMHWRLHLTVLAFTFLVFPILGLLCKPLLLQFLPPDLYLGILFLCVLPSTVQSSIAFTAVARGNVPAAICSASASNLFGIFISPLWVSMVISSHNDSQASLDAVWKITEQLLLPFIVGQCLRPWLLNWLEKNRDVLRKVDQSSILLVVYVAFSEAVNQGVWKQLPWTVLLQLFAVCAVLLAMIMLLTTYASRKFRFSEADEITVVFCGSKKSLASGVPMAKVLFSVHTVGMILLPLMLFHQLQLMVCSLLAQHYAKRGDHGSGS